MTTVLYLRKLGGRAARAALFSLFAFATTLFTAGEARAQWVTNGNNINNTNTGSVGIGTSNPEGALHVQSADTTVLRVVSTGSATTGRSVFQMYRGTASNANGWDFGYNTDLSSEGFSIRELTNSIGTTRFSISKNTGNVGIGTPTPATPLHISYSNQGAETLATFSNTNVGQVRVQFIRSADTGTGLHRGTVLYANVADAGWADYEGRKVHFLTGSGASSTPRMTIDGGGNVGIGTTSPTTKLHVAGDIRVDGNISAKYQDVAEWVPSTQKLAAGTVVVLDTGRDNHVLASTSAYDTRVAGVISAQPGLSLGEGGAGKVLVATTGRVKVKVDATRAPIRVGDLIVTSDVSGVAMRSQPLELGGVPIHRPGTLIGKALESLEKGTGEILVLLSLQ